MSTKPATWIDSACRPHRQWMADRGEMPDLATAWRECPQGDWLLFLAARGGVDRKLVVAAMCACARRLLPHLPEGEPRPLAAIETAERWCRGEASLDEVRAARESLRPLAQSDISAEAYFANSAAANACSAVFVDRRELATYASSVSPDTADLARAMIPFAAVQAALEGGVLP